MIVLSKINFLCLPKTLTITSFAQHLRKNRGRLHIIPYGSYWVEEKVNLAAEKLLAAQRGTRKIAVEIKSFLGASTLDEFEDALGQFLIYKVALETDEPDRQLYLAIPASVYSDFFLMIRSFWASLNDMQYNCLFLMKTNRQ